jgi:Na+/H+-dicarboxylate symporter
MASKGKLTKIFRDLSFQILLAMILGIVVGKIMGST